MPRRYDHYRKQQIYRAIEADNARASMDGVVRKQVTTAPPAPLPQRADDRDPIEVARAAQSAMSAAVS